jgi:hypothetical protein
VMGSGKYECVCDTQEERGVYRQSIRVTHT